MDGENTSKNPFKAAIGFIVLKFEDNDKNAKEVDETLRKVHDELLKLKLLKLDSTEFEELSDMVDRTHIKKVDAIEFQKHLRDYVAFKARVLVYVGWVALIISSAIGGFFYFLTHK